MLARNRGKPTPEIAIPAGVNDSAGNLGVLNLDAQGALKVSVSGAGSGGTSSNFGDPDPVAGTAAGFRDPSNNMAMAKVDSQGRLLVVPSGGASGGTSAVDEATFTPGTDSYTPNGGLFNDSATNLTSGQAGVVRATASRALHSNLRNNSGTEIGTASNPVRIDPSGTTAQPVKLQDGSGNPIAATGTSLNVNITGGGSGGGAVTIADGADVTQGALTDAKVVGDNSGTVSAKLRGLNTTLTSIDGKVTAVNTGAVVVASSALPTGASTSAKQPALGTAGTASADVITVQGITSMTALKVDGSAVTQPVSAASLPLPTGAATAAKQPAIGTAGSSSADVLSVQGIASGTAMPVSLASAPLPTGAATEATLSALNTKVTTVNTGAVVVASSALPSGAATETTLGTRALETGGNLASIVTQLGAVTASPTANTVLDRLKALLTGIVLSAGTALIGKVGIDQTTPGATNLIAASSIGRTTLPSSVSSGSFISWLLDRYGRAYSISPVLTLTSSAGTAITTNTNTSLVSAPSAGNHLRVYRVWAQNSSAVGTWCYLGNGSGVKTIPFYLAQYQPMMMNLNGSWELSTATALFMNTATTGANIEWFIETETLAD